MKICRYCNTSVKDDYSNCPSCNAREFYYVCQHCSTSFDTKFCPNCGKSPQESVKTCPNCGNITSDVFCSRCGTNLASKTPHPNYTTPPVCTPPPVVQQHQTVNNFYTTQHNVDSYHGKQCYKWTAFLLCLLLGYFGAHKFYEGKTGMGILYIFTIGLFGIGWIADCIILLCKPNPYFVR